MGPMQERRRHPRLPAKDLRCEVRFPSWEVYRLVYAVNISKGGIRFAHSRELEVGEVVQISLRLPDSSVATIKGEVRNVEDTGPGDNTRPAEVGRYQIGAQFRDDDANSAAGLAEVLKQLQREFLMYRG